MQFTVDSPRVFLMKNGSKSLSFTLIQADGDMLVTIPGFRLMDGYIHPPCIYRKAQRTYVPIFACSNSVSYAIHAEIERKNWPVVYGVPPLLQVPEAVKKLELTAEVAGRVAPNTLKPVDN